MSGEATFQYLNSSENCQRIENESLSILEKYNHKSKHIDMWEAVVIILTTGFFTIILATVFSFIRKHIYKDADHLDTSFDAGGNVNAGLTATTVVSQWTWAATLLQSSAVAAKYGISGSFWYAAGASIQILLFSMLSIQLKIRAPGAKTFLQVIKARFGKKTHLVFCLFALATNVIVTAMLMLGGAAVITSLVHHISVEYAITLVTAVIGSYTFIGGLGATFYVSFFNTAIIYIVMLILIMTVYETGTDKFLSVGSISNVFDYVACAKGPDGNEGQSYLTINSDQGLMFGLINIVGNFGTVFVDQSYWQSSVAAKPKQGVTGFLLGGITWFAIPFSLSTTMGLAYVAMSAEQGADLLSLDQINKGLVAPTVASRLLGKSGAMLIMVMVLMAITSTGSAEVMAVTSIMIYDIYSVYLKPYRLTNDTNSCILCGKGRGRMANPRDKCECVSLNFCAKCHADTKMRAECRRAIKPDYKCPTHGSFRVYNDYLARLKSWALVWVTMCIVPFTLLLYMADVGLGWVYLFMGVLVGSAVIPITLCMFWERLTAKAMVAGAVGGTIMSMTAWLSAASTYDGGLSKFKENTGRETVMLIGNLVAILGGGFLTVLISFVGNFRDFDSSTSGEIWETTRDIDNPLSPWTDKYKKELALTDSHRLDNRPSLADTQKAFKNVRILAYIMSIALTLTLIIAWPSILVAVGIMNSHEFESWVKLSEVWAFMAAVLMIIFPLCNEAYDIWSVFSNSKKIGDDSLLLTEEARKESETSRRQSKPQDTTTSGPKRGMAPLIIPDMSIDKQQQGPTFSTSTMVFTTSNNMNDSNRALESEDGGPLPAQTKSDPQTSLLNSQECHFPNNTLSFHNTNQLSTLPSTMIDMGAFKNGQPTVKLSPVQPVDAGGARMNESFTGSRDDLSMVDEQEENLTHSRQNINNTIRIAPVSPVKSPMFSVSKSVFTNITDCDGTVSTPCPSDSNTDIAQNESLF